MPSVDQKHTLPFEKITCPHRKAELDIDYNRVTSHLQEKPTFTTELHTKEQLLVNNVTLLKDVSLRTFFIYTTVTLSFIFSASLCMLLMSNYNNKKQIKKTLTMPLIHSRETPKLIFCVFLKNKSFPSIFMNFKKCIDIEIIQLNIF